MSTYVKRVTNPNQIYQRRPPIKSPKPKSTVFPPNFHPCLKTPFINLKLDPPPPTFTMTYADSILELEEPQKLQAAFLYALSLLPNEYHVKYLLKVLPDIEKENQSSDFMYCNSNVRSMQTINQEIEAQEKHD